MTMMTKKKKIKYTPGQAITNIDELRAAKRHLQRQMKTSEEAQDNSLLGKAVGFVENLTTDNSFATNGVEKSLNFVSNKISTRYPMGGVSKLILSGLVVLAVPIITNKIQKFVQDKF